jgi:glycosyltransferase involved in cell wall biosynthesis
MDGQEWKRQKYNRLTRRFLKYAEKLAVKGSKMLVADSPVIKKYLHDKYNKRIAEIAYGAHIPESYDKEMLKEYHVTAGNYDLVLARMEPENNIEMIIRAKIKSKGEQPLLIIGNKNKYSIQLEHAFASHKVVRFLGPVYNSLHINNLRYFSRYYLHGHSVGGTNPSLLEAMACSCNIVAHNNPFNGAVLNREALYFSNEDELSGIFSEHPAPEFVIWKEENKFKIRNKYNWDLITDAYEQLFRDAINT